MNEIQQQLAGASQDELLLCIELLALNIAQHRTKSGSVAFRKSMEQLRTRSEGVEQNRFYLRGKEVLEEALEVVRVETGVREAPVSTADPDATRAEKRNQFRVNVKAPVKVLWPDAPLPEAAILENISWGGAAIHIAGERAGTGDTLRILLPGASASIPIEAVILRTWPLPAGDGQGIATRFSSLRPRDETELENYLEQLAQSADDGGLRNSARLTQLLELEYSDLEELKTTLHDISAGGLGITVPEPLQIGQSLQAMISTLDGRVSLKLRARVVRQDKIDARNTAFYRAGLKFEHPTAELQESVNELIRRIARP